MKRSGLFLTLLVIVVFAGNYGVRASDVQDDFDEPALNPVWTVNSHPDIVCSLIENKGFFTVNIPGGRPYDLWSNDTRDGLLMVRRDQGSKDWIIETRIGIRSKADGFQGGLVVWSNPYVMYFWTLYRDPGQKNLRLLGEPFGISNLKKNKHKLDLEDQAVLRIEKLGKILHLQYWDEETEAFLTYDTYKFKFPVEGVGIMARTTSSGQNEGVKIMVDYFKLIN